MDIRRLAIWRQSAADRATEFRKARPLCGTPGTAWPEDRILEGTRRHHRDRRRTEALRELKSTGVSPQRHRGRDQNLSACPVKLFTPPAGSATTHSPLMRTTKV